MGFDFRIHIIVPLEYKDTANSLAKQIDPVGGEKTFGDVLLGHDEFAATHTACSTAADQSLRDQIMVFAVMNPWAIVSENTNFDSLIGALGLIRLNKEI